MFTSRSQVQDTVSDYSMTTITANNIDHHGSQGVDDALQLPFRVSEKFVDEKERDMGSEEDNLKKEGGLGHTEVTVHLDFADLRYTPLRSQKSREPQREILHGLSGSARAGEVLAIMGPSGGGKTSLLNILSSRTTRGVEGQIYLNGHPRTAAAKRVTGYVMQKDIFFETLTVYETIMYTALLRLPRNMSYDEKLERVEEVIRELGLEKCKHTRLGTAQERGISGGELKRVNVANELIFNPAMCILDEPTSGLDSAAAMSLVENLMTLAKKWRRTIIMSIHQPSSQIFAKFDKLILMMNGNIVFQGPARNTFAYFASLGFECPRGFNIADFVMDVLADDANETALLAAYRERIRFDAIRGWRLQMLDDQIPCSLSPPTSTSEKTEDEGLFSSHSMSKSEVEAHRGHVERLASDKSLTVALQQHPELDPSYLYQVFVLMKRGIRKEARGIITVMDLVQVVGVAILTGLLWFRSLSGLYESRIPDRVGLLFFMCSYWMWMPAYGELASFPDEKNVVARERSSKSYPVSAYFFSRMFSSIPISFVMPTLFLVIVYPMVGMEASAAAVFGTWGITMLGMSVAISYGGMIAVLCGDTKTSSVVAMVSLLLVHLACGFYVANDHMPFWFRWVKWLSFMDYTFTGILHVHFDSKVFECDVGGVYACPFEGKDVLLQQSRVTPLWGCVLGLLGFFVLFRAATYLVLRYSRKLKMD